MGGPLEGLTVLTMAHQYPGPYCTMLLGDLGCKVIVVEQPGIGDPARLVPGHLAVINRNKKSLALNLKSEKGREICYQLAKKSDIFLEGFRPGVAEGLRVDYPNIRRINPLIIYCSISGCGQDGPYRLRPAHDLTYQGMAGMLSDPRSMSPGFGVAIADLSSGMFATIGILAALLARNKYGKGQYVDVSMLDGLVSWMSVPLGRYFTLGQTARPCMPGNRIYQTKDNKYLTVSIVHEDYFWRNLCRVIGREDLAELSWAQREERCEELLNALQEAFLSRTQQEWVDALVLADVPSGPVLRLQEVANDPHIQSRGMIVEVKSKGGETVKQVGCPLKFSETPAEIRTLPPDVGEHTEEVLKDLGYGIDDIKELRKQKVI